MNVEHGVALAEVAKVQKRTVADVEADCLALGVFVGRDWADRPAVSEVEAAGLVSGSLRRDHDQRQAWANHQAATETWERERERVRADAYQATRVDVLRQGTGEPKAATLASQAALEAAQRFERQHPAPEFNGAPTAQSWLRSAVGRMVESVR